MDDLSHVYPEIDALVALGRLDDIDPLVRRSTQRPARSWVSPGGVMLYAELRLQSAGRESAAQGLFEQALRWYDSDAVSALPPDATALPLARSFYYLERWDEARARFQRLRSGPMGSSRYDGTALGYLAFRAARCGDLAELSRLRTSFSTDSSSGPSPATSKRALPRSSVNPIVWSESATARSRHTQSPTR